MNRNAFKEFTSQKNNLVCMKERIANAFLELDDLKESGCSDKAIEGMHQYIDILKQHMKEEVEKTRFVVDSIAAIEDPVCKQVMTMKFLEGHTWKQVQEKTGLSQSEQNSMKERFFKDLGI